MMTRTIRISVPAAEAAKRKAGLIGMKLYRFIELAIADFNVQVVERRDRTPRRKAG